MFRSALPFSIFSCLLIKIPQALGLLISFIGLAHWGVPPSLLETFLVSYNSSPSWKWKGDQIFLRWTQWKPPLAWVCDVGGERVSFSLSYSWLGELGWGVLDMHRGILPRLREIGMVPINNQLLPQLVAIVFIW